MELKTNWLNSFSPIRSGKLNGISEGWQDNGQLAKGMTMVDGKAHGKACSWFPSGNRKAQVKLRMGTVIEQSFWKEGGKPVQKLTVANQLKPQTFNRLILKNH